MTRLIPARSLLAALALVLGAAAPAAATPPGLNGMIAFDAPDANNVRQIYMVNDGGEGFKQLTTDGGTNPAWSPDGSRIAYVDAVGHIEVMNADGTGHKDLTPTMPGTLDDPAWRTDDEVGFDVINNDDPSPQYDVVVCPASGGTCVTQASLPDHNERLPAFAPASATMAYVLDDAGIAIEGYPAITQGAIELFAPSWAPSGGQLAYIGTIGGSDSDVHVINTDGSADTNLSKTSWLEEQAPSFSPDGKQLVVSGVLRPPAAPDEDLYVMSTDPLAPNVRKLALTSGGENPDWQRLPVVYHTVSGTPDPGRGGAVQATSDTSGASCSQGSCSVPDGGTVTLTALIADGYRFGGWSGACSGTDVTCTLTNVTSDLSAVAHYTVYVPPTPTPTPAPSPTPTPTPSPPAAKPPVGPLSHTTGAKSVGSYCTSSGNCAPLNTMPMGSCATSVGGNPDVSLTGPCLKLTYRNHDAAHGWYYGFNPGGPVAADGVEFTGINAATYHVDERKIDHFAVYGPGDATFRGVHLATGSFSWFIDPAGAGGYRTGWNGPHGLDYGRLPLPSGATADGLDLAWANPPTFSAGVASVQYAVNAPQYAGGATSDPVTKRSDSAGPPFAQLPPLGPPADEAAACHGLRAIGVPVSVNTRLHFPYLQVAGIGVGYNADDFHTVAPESNETWQEVTASGPTGFDSVTTMRGVVVFIGGDGVARQLFLCLEGTGIQLPAIVSRINSISLGVQILPGPAIAGGLDMSVGPTVPLFGTEPVRTSGHVSADFGHAIGGGPWSLHADGNTQFFGHDVADTSLDYSSVGYFGADFRLDRWNILGVGLGPVDFSGAVDSDRGWYFDGQGAVSVLGFDLADADVLISNLGFGICGTVFGGDLGVTVDGSGPHAAFSCDGVYQLQPPVRPTCRQLQNVIGDARLPEIVRQMAQEALDQHVCVDVGTASAARAHAAATGPGGVLTAQVKGSPTSESFVFTGDSGPPNVVLGGAGVDVDATRTAVTAQALVVRDAKARTTTISVRSPKAGAYVAAVQPGPAVVSFRTADGRPAPSVKARVRRGAGGYALAYRVAPQQGQTVTFIEDGGTSGETIGRAKGAKGVLRFTPSAGPAGTRKILATVTAPGAPPRQLTVATYRAPAPARLPAPRLAVRVTKAGVVASAAPTAGARRFVWTVRATDGRHWTVPTSRRTLTVRPVSAGTARVTVSVAGIDRDNRQGRAAKRTARLVKAPPRVKRDRHPRKKA